VVKNGETAVMCTAIAKQKQSAMATFLPLSVDYRLKSAAAGRIPTNYMRREMGKSEENVALRKIFKIGYFRNIRA
jgi:polyribonucleotide nucleotidyltransferase